jgi:hypothetical protein
MSENNEIQDAEILGSTETAIEKAPQGAQAIVKTFSPSDLLKPTHGDAAAPDRSFASVPYVGFLGKKSEKNVEAIKAAGIQVNDFYLMAGAAGPVRVKPFGVHILGQTFRAFTLQDDEGKLIDAALKYDKRRDDEGYQEHIFAVVAVALPADAADKPSTFVAATLTLRGAQAKALKKSLDLLGTADKPGVVMNPAKWSAFGEAHKIASASKWPGGRFRANILSTPTVPVNGGRPYNLGDSVTFPTPRIDVAAFDAWVESDWSSIEQVLQAHERRVQVIRKKALGG